jgi:hypothetical protein
VILLDTGSTLKATFMNPELVTDIQVANTPISMRTNAGSKKIELEATVPGFGPTWFDPDQIANIYGFTHLVDKYRITYDSDNEDAFVVHTDSGFIKFRRTSDGLYAYEPTTKFKENVATIKEPIPNKERLSDSGGVRSNNLIATVRENRMGYSQKQFERAKRARRLYHIVGCPTVDNFKHILRQNIIKNCPVTPADVNVTEKIFGGDIGALKGKTTRRRPVPVQDDEVEISPEMLDPPDPDLTYCMDIMYVNGMPMMTGIDKTIRFRGLVPMHSRVAAELYRALDEIL